MVRLSTPRHRSDNSGWIFALYLPLLVLAPLPFGGNRPWAWAAIELWVLVLALCWLAGYIRGTILLNPVIRDARPVLVAVSAWVGYVWFQLVPLPLPILEVLSSQAAHWHLAAAYPDVPSAAPLTLDRFATFDGACLSTAYAAFLGLSLALLNRRKRVQAVAYALVLSGILQVTYATATAFSHAAEPWRGTFVNRNHFAGYLILCLAAGIGALIGSMTGAKIATWRQFLRNMLDWMLTRRIVLRLALLAMVVALVLSRSRMANVAFFISLLATGLVGLALSRHATRSVVILLASLVAMDLLVVGTYFGASQVVERIVHTTTESEDRDEVARYALDLWRDYPLFGAGLGAFRAVFPRYSGEGTSAAYTHAHNDYLEFAAETGALGLCLLGLIVSMSLLAALRAQSSRKDPVMRGASFAAMMGITASLIHGAAEFTFQIPANALTFMLLLAFAWISLHHRNAPGEASGATARQPNP